jgi:hypothetical protein
LYPVVVVRSTGENERVPPLPELPATPETTLYSRELLVVGLEQFEREGLWLLLSLHHYGWRAHADVAALLVSDVDPLELGDHHFEHRSMAALEELFLLLDQLWRTISGIRSHRAGERFLDGYRRYGANVASELESLQAMTEEDWSEVFGMPTDEELPRVLAERGAGEDLTQVGEMRRDVLATTLRNMEEISVFFVRTEPVEGREGRSLRDVNNSYRHGTQIVYEDASPQEIPWRAANPADEQGMLVAAEEVDELARAQTVNVLLEGPDAEGHARFASMPRSPEVLESLVESMRNLSILLWRIVTAFIVAELLGGPVLSSIGPFTWEELDARYRADEAR